MFEERKDTVLNDNIELIRLKQEVKELEEKIDKMTPRASLACLCENEPYSGIRYDPVTDSFYYKKRKTKIWQALTNAARTLFVTDLELEKYVSRPHYQRTDYCDRHAVPTRVSEMTVEQQAIAANFVDDVIEIYNNYFMEINKFVVVNGEKIEVEVRE